jgi:hypothetical protein
VLWGSLLLVSLVFILPVFGATIIYLALRFTKKVTISLYIGIAGCLIWFVLITSGHGLAYFAFIGNIKLPYISTIMQKYIQEKMGFYSILGVLSFTLIFQYIIHLFVKYILKMPIQSKQDRIKAIKSSGAYTKFRKMRIDFLLKQQLKYRQSDSKEVFIGYSDLKERVVIPGKELNYHGLLIGGTGTGKTTLIAAIMEGRLRVGIPIIFVDGKGERKSMLEFKKLCEAYGKRVYMFSEKEPYTYNPIKYGTATEIRDKIMNLFEWSEPFYKNFASRYLQLVVRLINGSDLTRDLYSVFRCLSTKEVGKVFDSQMIIEEIEVEVEEETEPSTEDPFANLEGPHPTNKRTRKEKRQVKKLPEHLQELQVKFGEFLNNDDSERNLTGLRNQLGELLESDLSHLFKDSENEIDLRKITDRGEVVIFSISGNRYKDYIKKLGKIIVLDVNSLVAYRQETGKKTTLCIYDEFSAYGNGEVVDIVNKSRSAGFECIISTQTVADLDAVEPFLTSRIIANCNILATGRDNVPEDAEILAKVFSTFTDVEFTSQIENKNNLLKILSEKGTVRDVEAFIAHPREIKALQIGEIFLSRKMVEEGVGKTYTRRVYVRNALETEGIPQKKELMLLPAPAEGILAKTN